MKKFMGDYYNLYLQGNDTVTQLSNNDLFKYTIVSLDEKAKQLLGQGSPNFGFLQT